MTHHCDQRVLLDLAHERLSHARLDGLYPRPQERGVHTVGLDHVRRVFSGLQDGSVACAWAIMTTRAFACRVCYEWKAGRETMEGRID